MCLTVVEVQSSSLAGLCQYGMTKSDACRGSGIKVRKGMEGIALYLAAIICGVEKTRVEVGVVSYQDGPVASGVFYFSPHVRIKLA